VIRAFVGSILLTKKSVDAVASEMARITMRAKITTANDNEMEEDWENYVIQIEFFSMMNAKCMS
jgi:hypothetical protein